VGFLGWIVLGLIMGAIGKAVLPGRMTGGWFATLILGVIGAVVGGWIGSIVFDAGLEEFFSLQTWVLAFVGTLVVLLVWGAITGRNKRT